MSLLSLPKEAVLCLAEQLGMATDARGRTFPAAWLLYATCSTFRWLGDLRYCHSYSITWGSGETRGLCIASENIRGLPDGPWYKFLPGWVLDGCGMHASGPGAVCPKTLALLNIYKTTSLERRVFANGRSYRFPDGCARFPPGDKESGTGSCSCACCAQLGAAEAALRAADPALFRWVDAQRAASRQRPTGAAWYKKMFAVTFRVPAVALAIDETAFSE